jgi:hypothetical protein
MGREAPVAQLDKALPSEAGPEAPYNPSKDLVLLAFRNTTAAGAMGQAL